MSTLEVNKITPAGAATEVTLGDSGDTLTLTAGANLTLGGASSTITIPSGATITNNGTASGFGGGKLGQIQINTGTNNVQTLSTSYVDVMTTRITPSSTSSTILIIHSGPSTITLSNNSNMGHIAIFRDSTNITTGGHNSSFHSYQGNSKFAGSSVCIIDSPSSTSEIAYRVKAKVDNSSVQFDYNTSSQSRMISLACIEILA